MKASKANSRAATLRTMLGMGLPCGPLLVGGVPLFCWPPPLGTGVAVGVRLVVVCVGIAKGVAGGVGVGAIVGVGVNVTGVGVTMQLQEIVTEFIGPVMVIVSLAGQVMLAGIVMSRVSFPLACSMPCAGLIVTPAIPWLVADHVRFRLGFLFMIVTVHCLQLVKLVGEASIIAPTSTVWAAEAALVPETSGAKIASTLNVISAKSAQSSRRCVRTLRGSIIVSSLLPRKMYLILILPASILGRAGKRGR